MDLALQLWSTTRMIEYLWRICGDDTLGIPLITDTSNPWYGTIPIPPAVDTQLDQIVIQNILVPLRAKLLGRLQEMINNHRPDTWFEIYLTIFILLTSAESSACHSKTFSKRHRLSVCAIVSYIHHVVRILANGENEIDTICKPP